MWSALIVEGQGPSPRANHGAVLTKNGNIVFFGGYTDAMTYSNEIFVLDTVNLRWSKPILNGIPPTPRESFSISLVRGQIWSFF